MKSLFSIATLAIALSTGAALADVSGSVTPPGTSPIPVVMISGGSVGGTSAIVFTGGGFTLADF